MDLEPVRRGVKKSCRDPNFTVARFSRMLVDTRPGKAPLPNGFAMVNGGETVKLAYSLTYIQ